VAQRHGATSRQVALAFVVREAGTYTIPKAARVAHVEDNAGANQLTLTADDVATLDRAMPRGDSRALPVL
jgi:diketogulonate reductase-like aldo/keto reductase